MCIRDSLSPLQSLVVLIPVIAFEVWLVVKYLLPVMGDLVTKTLYSLSLIHIFPGWGPALRGELPGNGRS